MKFDVDEMLRYFAVGIFFILLLYINMNDLLLLQQTETLNKVSSSSLWLLGGCLLSGFFIYAIYRSFLYPLIINLLVTLLVRKRWRSTFPEYADLKVIEITDQVDLLRMEMKSDVFKRCLSHWASHVHFLYNSAFVCWFYAVISRNDWCKKELSYVWLVIGIILFLISLLYHYRYKKFEMKLIQRDLKKTISEQEAQSKKETLFEQKK